MSQSTAQEAAPAAPRRAQRRAVLLLAVSATLLSASVYCSYLDVAPLYLTKDEVSYGIQSHAVATTGRDINGRLFPLYFEEPGFTVGRDPLYIYASALVLQFRPLTAAALRVPTTVAASIAIGLVVLVAYEMYGSLTLAALAGLLAVVTPVFFIRSRAALAVILPVPFQLMWLLFLLRYSRDGRLRHMLLAVAALAAGMYCYLSMLFFAPLHLLFSLAEVSRQRRVLHAVAAVALFGALLLPIAWWQLEHPGHINELASTYRVYPAGLTPLQGVKDVMSWSSLSRRSDIYWNAFNPSRLFFSGESSLIDSTRSAGLFPLVYLVLLPLGCYDWVRRPVSVPRLAVLSVFLLGPVPGALVGEETIARYLIIVPLAALLAVGAIDRLWKSGWLVCRAGAAGAVVLSVFLFYGFYHDYFGEWRVSSALYLGGNLKGAMEQVLSVPPAAAPDVIYLSERIPYVPVYWEFYRRAHNRADLVGRERGLRLQDDDWRVAPGRAMAIVPGGDDPSADTLRAAGWSVVAEIHEFYGGPPSFFVLVRG